MTESKVCWRTWSQTATSEWEQAWGPCGPKPPVQHIPVTRRFCGKGHLLITMSMVNWVNWKSGLTFVANYGCLDAYHATFAQKIPRLPKWPEQKWGVADIRFRNNICEIGHQINLSNNPCYLNFGSSFSLSIDAIINKLLVTSLRHTAPNTTVSQRECSAWATLVRSRFFVQRSQGKSLGHQI